MHLLVLGVIAILVFGPKRLPELGRSLGSGIRGFKHALDHESDPKEDKPESDSD